MRQLNQLFKRRVNTQLVDELLNKTQTEVDKMQPLNVLVAGKTGSGKSTLINALFRENLAYYPQNPARPSRRCDFVP